MLSKNINLALIVDSMLFQSQAITLSHSHSSKAFLLEVGFADEPQQLHQGRLTNFSLTKSFYHSISQW